MVDEDNINDDADVSETRELGTKKGEDGFHLKRTISLKGKKRKKGEKGNEATLSVSKKPGDLNYVMSLAFSFADPAPRVSNLENYWRVLPGNDSPKIQKIRELLEQNGVVFLRSPTWGSMKKKENNMTSVAFSVDLVASGAYGAERTQRAKNKTSEMESRITAYFNGIADILGGSEYTKEVVSEVTVVDVKKAARDATSAPGRGGNPQNHPWRPNARHVTQDTGDTNEHP